MGADARPFRFRVEGSGLLAFCSDLRDSFVGFAERAVGGGRVLAPGGEEAVGAGEGDVEGVEGDGGVEGAGAGAGAAVGGGHGGVWGGGLGGRRRWVSWMGFL